MFKKKLLLLLLLGLVVLCKAENKKPFTVPEVKEWKGGEGLFLPSGIIFYDGSVSKIVAEQLVADYKVMFGKTLVLATGKASAGSIVLKLAGDKRLGEEGYTMNITD
ncbi:MAG: glycoside hydrolase family 20 zincin-like fold domain-containing protein, partial [Prevotella sp.]